MQNNFACNDTKCAIVAGNGSSLAEIDYARLPSLLSCDIFRCNQFYFEDKYYLGREVRFAFAIPPVLFEQSYTYRNLIYRNEYDIRNIVVSDFNLDYMDSLYSQNKENVFSGIVRGSAVLASLREFLDFVQYNEVYHNRRITSGVYMCAFAVALGYTKIYIVGIDLYSTQAAYAFNTLRENLLTLCPDYSLTPRDGHSVEMDIEALQFLAQHYNVELYTPCPNSPLTKYIPLADTQGNAYRVESRSKNCIQDILIPPRFAYEKLNHKKTDEHYSVVCMLSKQEILNRKIFSYQQPLRDNCIYRVLRDLVRLPCHIIDYCRGSILTWRQKHAEDKK